MSEHWGEKVIELPGGGKTWRRTNRSEAVHCLGQDFYAEYHVERVFAFGEGIPVLHKPLGSVCVAASTAAQDSELAPHAAAIQEHTTAIVEILIRRQLAEGSLVDPDDPDAVPSAQETVAPGEA